MEVFHRPLLPAQIEHVLFPELGAAVVSQDEFSPGGLRGNEVDLGAYLSKDVVPDRVKELYRELLERAVGELAHAKAVHDELERIYIEAVDFTGTERMRQAMAARIFGG